MSSLKKLNALSNRRKDRIRKKISKYNYTNRLRLSVFRSGRHIYAQLIDDNKGVTLASASSLSFEKSDQTGVKAASKVGNIIATKILELGLRKEIVFDKGPYLFHGRVKAVADSARESGLIF